MTPEEQASALACIEDRFRRSDSAARLAMARSIVRHADEGVTLAEVAREGAAGSRSFRRFAESFAAGRRNPGETRRCVAAMHSFLRGLGRALEPLKWEIRLDGSVRPGCRVTLRPVESAPAVPKPSREAAVAVQIGGQAQVSGILIAAGDPAIDGVLHLSTPRVAGTWRPPDDMVRNYENWARTQPKRAGSALFRQRARPAAAPGGYPPSGTVLYSAKVSPEPIWNGRCWGCVRISTRRSEGVSGRLAEFQVARVEFRDHWMATREDTRLPQGGSALEFLRSRFASAAGTDAGPLAGPPPHAMVFVSTLVILPSRGAHGDPFAVLCLHRDPNRVYEPEKPHYWGSTAESLCVSARITEDPRGIDLGVQIRRMLQRQTGLEAEIGMIPVWLGARVEPEHFRVVLFAAVHIDATPAEVVAAFERRESRHLVERMAIVGLGRVESALAAHGDRLTAVELLGSNRPASSTLPTALALYLAWLGRARIVESAPA